MDILKEILPMSCKAFRSTSCSLSVSSFDASTEDMDRVYYDKKLKQFTSYEQTHFHLHFEVSDIFVVFSVFSSSFSLFFPFLLGHDSTYVTYPKQVLSKIEYVVFETYVEQDFCQRAYFFERPRRGENRDRGMRMQIPDLLWTSILQKNKKTDE